MVSIKVLLLQIFWLSFGLIGVAELKLLATLRQGRYRQAAVSLSETHFLVGLIGALALGMATFALVVIPGILWQWPIIIVKIAYISLLLVSLITLIGARTSILYRLVHLKPTRRSWLLFVIVGGVLLLDFLSSLRTGSDVFGDAQFELAQITMFAQQHLTLTDPIFGSQGVPPTAYSVSILHALQALASNLFHVSAAWVWYYSHAFFRLIIWISLFALSWEYLGKKVQAQWSYVILLLLPLLYGNNFMDPELHNKIVFAWTALFIVGVKLWLEKKGILLLLVAAVLMATTHPLNAFMAASFLGLLACFMLVLRLMRLRQAAVLVPIMAVLLLPMILYFYYPHGITSAGFNDASYIGGPAFSLHSYGPLYINLGHTVISAFGLVFYTGLAAYVYVAFRIPNIRLRAIILLLAFMAMLTYYNSQIVSLIGYSYLVIKAGSKSIRLAIILLVVFLGLIVYNPILLTAAHGRLPLWTLSRFAGLNMLAYIAPTVGLLCIMVLPALSFGYKRLATVLTIGVAVFSLTILPIVDPSVAVTDVLKQNVYHQPKVHLDKLQALQVFSPQLRGQIVFSDDVDLPAMLPAVTVTSLFSIENEANANPAVHIGARRQCAQQLRKTLAKADLRASGITEIITQAPPEGNFSKLLASSPDVQLQKQASGYRLYKVITRTPTTVMVPTLCAIPPTIKS